MRAGPTRRGMLAAAASGSLLLAGCKGLAALGPVPGIGSDVRTLDRAVFDEELMVATYKAAITSMAAAGPGVNAGKKAVALVSGVLAEHERHLTALRARLVLPQRLATATPSPSPTAPSLPAGQAAMFAALATAERHASARLLRELVDAPAPLAQLMASIGASEASHALLLTKGRHA